MYTCLKLSANNSCFLAANLLFDRDSKGEVLQLLEFLNSSTHKKWHSVNKFSESRRVWGINVFCDWVGVSKCIIHVFKTSLWSHSLATKCYFYDICVSHSKLCMLPTYTWCYIHDFIFVWRVISGEAADYVGR